MACFTGYIELFDSIEFQSKSKWDNQITVLKDTNENEKTREKMIALRNKMKYDTINLSCQ